MSARRVSRRKRVERIEISLSVALRRFVGSAEFGGSRLISASYRFYFESLLSVCYSFRTGENRVVLFYSVSSTMRISRGIFV